MTIPHRPLGVIDISEELGSDGPLGLRDEAVMQLAGIPEYQDPEVLVVPDPVVTGPQGPLCVVRDDQGIDHPIVDVGAIDGTDIVVTREISMSHGGQDVRIRITGTSIVAVVEWGSSSGWEHPVHGMSFKGCTNLVSVPDTLPDWVADCREMFYGCGQFNDPAIVGWDVSRVKDMGYMFFVATSFNQDLSGWSVGQFSAQPDGFDQGASSWVLSRPRWSEVVGMAVNKSSIQVVDLEGKANIPPLTLTLRLQDGRVVTPTALGIIPGSDVTLSMADTQLHFRGSDLVEVVEWAKLPDNAPNITGYQFYECGNLTTVPTTIPGWITNMYAMFYGCTAINSDVSEWDTSKITNMKGMFYDCTAFNQDLSQWDTSKVTDMYGMFNNCTAFNQDLSGWDVSHVTDMYGMFNDCNVFNSDISTWDVSHVTDMRYMFRNCSAFNSDLSGWCVSKISSRPSDFDGGASSWTLPRPVWGTCPPRP